ncbi:uncharacterized protein LOC142228674 [Haematobia irritans]|uniref:uncharacterized protein LOC142228674 n=1 Tax=Haematobia irritans TaxID=7368 RepID=UPI003F4FA7AA
MEYLRNHCRTCQEKLLDGEDVTLKSLPDVDRLVLICLREGKVNIEQSQLDMYVPNICSTCLSKWQDFVDCYYLAVRSAEKLTKYLDETLSSNAPEKGDIKAEIELVDKSHENCLPTHIANIDDGNFETTSPLYEENLTDPFNEESDTQPTEDPINKSEIPPRKLAIVHKFSKVKRTICRVKRKCRNYKTKAGVVEEMKENETNSHSTNSNNKIRYHCELCNKYFYQVNKYEGHIKQIHEGVSKPYRCQVENCNKRYSKYKNLTYHIATNHTENHQEIFKCTECNDKIFKTKDNLKQHIRNQHIRRNSNDTTKDFVSDKKVLPPAICDQCGFIAANQYTLVQHIKNKHMETQGLKCEHCPKVFKSQNYLKYHMLSHNPTRKKPFQCTECPMAFGRKNLLNKHKLTHLQYTDRLKCDFEGCSVHFITPADKRLHMRLVHLKVKKHICDFCGEAFGALQTLRHHRYIHTGEKPYKCDVCGQGFRQLTAMKTHRKGHACGEKSSQIKDDKLGNTVEL